MDDDSSIKPKVKAEVRDGYVQLAEKMEQVRSQMAKMERKYDELYQTVKEKEHSRNPSVTADQSAAEASKSQRESVVEPTSTARSSVSGNTQDTPEKKTEESSGGKTTGEIDTMDIEKMEDNPFL